MRTNQMGTAHQEKASKSELKKLGMGYRILETDERKKQALRECQKKPSNNTALVLQARLCYPRSSHLLFTCACCNPAVKVLHSSMIQPGNHRTVEEKPKTLL